MPVYLSPDSLDWALRNIEVFGDTDIFPMPFEYAAIRHSWDGPDGLRTWLAGRDLFLWAARPYRRCLSPKHRFAFRVATQLDPLDTLVYTSLIYELGPAIESRRVPKERGVVHSYRFIPDPSGRMYDGNYSYDTFRQRSADFCDSGRFSFVAVTDIADFFPRLYSHPFENALRDCSSTHRDHASALIKLITQWNFTVSYGIPVGPAASRLLSELAICDVDESLLSERQAFCRFSDDYRLFCTDEREAYERLALLANVLFENHGLTLERSKT